MASPIMYESNESDTDESIPEIDLTLKLTVQPYQYEPVKRQETTRQPFDDESDSGQSAQGSVHSDDEISEQLPSDMHWCSCKNCITMPTARECKCCHFYAAIESRLEERGETCITEHEGFAANCLNRWVLETSFNL
ncbi:uncharacterized protein LOC133175292 [Saccostrea echinata]|uniref:uncharacterized protein LOC133175292 n=1 Tax=Saccostrea echinata TaxID=191078 RepID=UPI002A817DCC|nr:uncharacterized protein LOC133175292 [Saccostrea echinata]